MIFKLLRLTNAIFVVLKKKLCYIFFVLVLKLLLFGIMSAVGLNQNKNVDWNYNRLICYLVLDEIKNFAQSSIGYCYMQGFNFLV